MSIKRYGIYLNYSPRVNLSNEGLGRYLIAFLKAASHRSDIRFVVACPSWFRGELQKLCRYEGLSTESFDLLSPNQKPILLSFYEAYAKCKQKSKKVGRLKSLLAFLKRKAQAHQSLLEKKLVTSRSFIVLPFVLAYAAILFCISLPILILISLFCLLKPRLIKRLKPYLKRGHAWLQKPKENVFLSRWYSLMQQGEVELMLNKINQLKDVRAWYCHSAFWPSFNRIDAPHIVCVPDVVLKEFPVGFSENNNSRLLDSFKEVEQMIVEADHYITYSHHIKSNTLMKQYAIPGRAIHVIPHAPNDLSHWVQVTGFSDNEATSLDYCQQLLKLAFAKSSQHTYLKHFMNDSVKFLFYASQFRPSKNILTLLRAYRYLLKERYIGHKLILTGDWCTMRAAEEYVQKHRLSQDVLCLYNLASRELAACYKLADLAVNPSLSEGACPFTLTEALSVGTPVVMSNIPVTLEIIQDEALQEMMLFDPYDWKSLASRIEWALQHSAVLLSHQKIIYEQLSERNWDDVVNEHIDILDQISSGKANDELPRYASQAHVDTVLEEG